MHSAFTLTFLPCLAPRTGSAVSRGFKASGQGRSYSGQIRFKLCLGKQKLCSVPLSDSPSASATLSRDSKQTSNSKQTSHRRLPASVYLLGNTHTLYSSSSLLWSRVAFLFLKVPRLLSINSPGHKWDEFLSLLLVATDIPYL